MIHHVFLFLNLLLCFGVMVGSRHNVIRSCLQHYQVLMMRLIGCTGLLAESGIPRRTLGLNLVETAADMDTPPREATDQVLRLRLRLRASPPPPAPGRYGVAGPGGTLPSCTRRGRHRAGAAGPAQPQRGRSPGEGGRLAGAIGLVATRRAQCGQVRS